MKEDRRKPNAECTMCTKDLEQDSVENTYSRCSSESDLSPISLSESIEDATLRMLPTSVT